MSRPRTDQTYASVVASTPTSTTQTSHMIPSGGRSPMEIDVTCRRGPLPKAENKDVEQTVYVCIVVVHDTSRSHAHIGQNDK